jgi:ABC-type amino acid transport system permease subunit
MPPPQSAETFTAPPINQNTNRDKPSFLETITAAPEQTQVADQVNNSDIIYPLEISPFIGMEYFTMCFAFMSLSRSVEKLPKLIISI